MTTESSLVLEREHLGVVLVGPVDHDIGGELGLGPTQASVADIMGRLQANGGAIDRSAFDEFLFEMMRTTEDHGLQSAPRWPAVAMTPPAIYRQMPAAPSLPDEASEAGPT